MFNLLNQEEYADFEKRRSFFRKNRKNITRYNTSCYVRFSKWPINATQMEDVVDKFLNKTYANIYEKMEYIVFLHYIFFNIEKVYLLNILL